MKTQPSRPCAGSSGINGANAGFGPGSSRVLNAALLSWAGPNQRKELLTVLGKVWKGASGVAVLILPLHLLWGRGAGFIFAKTITGCSFTCPMSQIQPAPSQLTQDWSWVTR